MPRPYPLEEDVMDVQAAVEKVWSRATRERRDVVVLAELMALKRHVSGMRSICRRLDGYVERGERPQLDIWPWTAA